MSSSDIVANEHERHSSCNASGNSWSAAGNSSGSTLDFNPFQPCRLIWALLFNGAPPTQDIDSASSAMAKRRQLAGSARPDNRRHLLFFLLTLGILSSTHAEPPSNPPSTSTAPPTGSPSPSPSTFPPTVSPAPTAYPSIPPSEIPSITPSNNPTAVPTFSKPSTATSRFNQDFTVENGRIFDELETEIFQVLYQSYTLNFAPRDVVERRIDTECKVLGQDLKERRRRMPSGSLNKARLRHLQSTATIQVVFSMAYESLYTNVTGFPVLFQTYVNSNLGQVAQQMQLLGLNVSEAFLVHRFVVLPDPTSAPTVTPSPSTMTPTSSRSPTQTPTILPSPMPSTEFPSAPPTPIPSQSPSGQPTGGPTDASTDSTVIVVSVVVAGSIILLGLLYYYRKRKLLRELEFQSLAAGNSRKKAASPQGEDNGSWNAAVARRPSENNPHSPETPNYASAFNRVGPSNNGALETGPPGVGSPSDSLVSGQSLLSAGNSMAGDSGDEADATHNLADEFDQYKDQNLEKMRTDVEGNLTGFDGMMSQALTRALLDDDDSHVDAVEVLWGGSGKLTGAEIEASALGEVTDWLKRNDTPAVEERRLFMQETLNKMVASVRHGVLGPEDASRSIHECAALLGLQLATEIPVTTLIISGMRKTVTARHMIDAFSEFGDISEAAVASNQRGFGILRFKASQSVDRAMNRFRNEEIVVQDVGVHVRVLRPGSTPSGVLEEDALPGPLTVPTT